MFFIEKKASFPLSFVCCFKLREYIPAVTNRISRHQLSYYEPGLSKRVDLCTLWELWTSCDSAWNSGSWKMRHAYSMVSISRYATTLEIGLFEVGVYALKGCYLQRHYFLQQLFHKNYTTWRNHLLIWNHNAPVKTLHPPNYRSVPFFSLL